MVFKFAITALLVSPLVSTQNLVQLSMLKAWGVPLSFTPVASEYLAIIPQLRQSFLQCNFESNSTIHPAGRAIRAAFHDAATHSVSLNTGGADGSLNFELLPKINLDFVPLIAFYNSIKTAGTSLADIIVLGSLIALSECSGPKLPMRFGRPDTILSFNSNAIPVSGERFGSIISKFIEMGFNVREMTILSVGGHSIVIIIYYLITNRVR